MKLSEISEALVEGNEDLATRLTGQAVAEGVPADAVYRDGLVKGMETVGKMMQSGEMFIPEVLMSAQVMKECLKIIKPSLVHAPQSSALGKVVVGTVQGDLHDIGKNLVIALLEGAGFEVTDLGVDVPTQRFVDVVKSVKPDILGLSALLSVTMLSMKEVVGALASAGLDRKVAVMVGGASVSQRFADEIGAGYAADAGGAVELAKSLLKAKEQ